LRFSDIPGQLAIKEKLIRTVSDQRVSHAQLFYGPESSAKLALAIAYAQYINCKKRQSEMQDAGNRMQDADFTISLTHHDTISADSCGVCPSCVKYQKLIHPASTLFTRYRLQKGSQKSLRASTSLKTGESSSCKNLSR